MALCFWRIEVKLHSPVTIFCYCRSSKQVGKGNLSRDLSLGTVYSCLTRTIHIDGTSVTVHSFRASCKGNFLSAYEPSKLRYSTGIAYQRAILAKYSPPHFGRCSSERCYHTLLTYIHPASGALLFSSFYQ